jgi:TRAP-type C4-dicarboxylate transport system permease small subunit
MKDILNRFSLESVKINSQTISIAVLLYIILVGCTIWSINVQPFNKRERSFWTMAVIFFGPIAILPYLAVAWRNAATGSLSFWRKPKRGNR